MSRWRIMSRQLSGVDVAAWPIGLPNGNTLRRAIP
jgi:hypothetical protein